MTGRETQPSMDEAVGHASTETGLRIECTTAWLRDIVNQRLFVLDRPPAAGEGAGAFMLAPSGVHFSALSWMPRCLTWAPAAGVRRVRSRHQHGGGGEDGDGDGDGEQ